MVDTLAAYAPARVVSSPWKRCVQTVEPFLDAHGGLLGTKLRTKGALSEDGHRRDRAKTADLVAQARGQAPRRRRLHPPSGAGHPARRAGGPGRDGQVGGPAGQRTRSSRRASCSSHTWRTPSAGSSRSSGTPRAWSDRHRPSTDRAPTCTDLRRPAPTEHHPRRVVCPVRPVAPPPRAAPGRPVGTPHVKRSTLPRTALPAAMEAWIAAFGDADRLVPSRSGPAAGAGEWISLRRRRLRRLRLAP